MLTKGPEDGKEKEERKEGRIVLGPLLCPSALNAQILELPYHQILCI